MLSFFRGHTKKIFWGLVAIIVPAFSLWGIGATMMDRKNNPSVGAVLGAEVTQRQFMSEKAAVRRLMEIEMADMVGGAGYNREWVRRYIQAQDIDSVTWRRLALLGLAERQGFEAGRQIVAAWLAGIRMFNTKAGFDYNAYVAFLKNEMRVDPVIFEEEMRRELIGRIMLKAITQASFVSALDEAELKRMRTERIKVKAAVFTPAGVRVDEALITDAALRDYFSARGEDFRVPVRRSGRFVILDYASAPEPTVAPEHIRAVYDANSANYMDKDGKVRPLDEVREDIRAEIDRSMRVENVRDRARRLYYSLVSTDSIVDFTQVAADEGLEIHETGWLTEADMDAADALVAGAAEAGMLKDFFAGAVGSVCPPLAAGDGVLLFIPDNEEASRIPAFEDARAAVELAFRTAKGRELAAGRAAEFAKGFSGTEADFGSAAAEAGASLEEQEPFSILAPAGLARDLDFDSLARLFACRPSSVSPAFALRDSALVFFVSGYESIEEDAGDGAAADGLEYARQAAYKKQMMSVEEMFSGAAAVK